MKENSINTNVGKLGSSDLKATVYYHDQTTRSKIWVTSEQNNLKYRGIYKAACA